MYLCTYISTDDVELPKDLPVYIKDSDCQDPIETQYFHCGFEPICIYCGDYLSGVDPNAEHYPQCEDCTQAPVPRRKEKK